MSNWFNSLSHTRTTVYSVSIEQAAVAETCILAYGGYTSRITTGYQVPSLRGFGVVSVCPSE
jgi:hypothetical protein